MGFPGKPDGIAGSEVESYLHDGKIQEIAAYCESDVINTYQVWLRHELFRGRLDQSKYEQCELHLNEFLDLRKSKATLSA